MLTVDSVASVLLERALIDVSAIVDCDLTIQSAARRNNNLRVERASGTGFFLKQACRDDERGKESLRREALFHQFCAGEPALSDLTRLLPRFVCGGGDDPFVIFELISGSVTLRAKLDEGGGLEAFVRATGGLGEALAKVHRVLTLPEWSGHARLSSLSHHIPWAMTLHKPVVSMFGRLSPANMELLCILQSQGRIAERLDGLGKRWQPRSLIHGDIRLDNILIESSGAAPESAARPLWITDWEMVQFGDPAWDLAGALQDLLVYWVSTMPLAGEDAIEDVASRARVPLAGVQRAARALWAGYRKEARLGANEADDFIRRAVAFSAARLIQSALEASDRASTLTGPAVLLMQICENLLADPGRGQAELYGIPSGSLMR